MTILFVEFVEIILLKTWETFIISNVLMVKCSFVYELYSIVDVHSALENNAIVKFLQHICVFHALKNNAKDTFLPQGTYNLQYDTEEATGERCRTG